MLYISLGAALVYILSLATNTTILYQLLCFNKEAILHGQVWRLFTYVFTYQLSQPLFTIITLICYYSLGRAMENVWGTLRFNLYYFCGIVMMDIFCMIFGGAANVTQLNLSLFLGYATLYPSTQFLLLFIIPVKAWIFALVDLCLIAFELIVYPFPYNLFSVIALSNYFLFFGADVLNILPMSWRANATRLVRKNKPKSKKNAPKVIPFPNAGSYQASSASAKAPYSHQCIVCGRTDVTNPELEFRYCSRCSDYRCYCEDHISNHIHQ
jgi:hypothetical protein